MLSDINFMKMAIEISNASQCVSKKVGAIIVKNGRILSSGYNGTPAGYENCNVHWNHVDHSEHHEWSKKYEIHAEMNAIIWAARKGIKINKSVIYCTHEPCHDCTKNIIASGIEKIVYLHDYKHTNKEEANKFLSDCGIEKVQINMKDKL